MVNFLAFYRRSNCDIYSRCATSSATPPQSRGELGGATEEEFKETIEEAQIGVKYFKDRKKIAREYKERLEKLTASKEQKIFREPKKAIKTLHSRVSSIYQLLILLIEDF